MSCRQIEPQNQNDVKKAEGIQPCVLATKAVRKDMRREEAARAGARGLAGSGSRSLAPTNGGGGGAAKPPPGSEAEAEAAGGGGAGGGGAGGGGATGADDGDGDDEGYVDVADTLKRLLRRLGAYPLILIVAWFWPTAGFSCPLPPTIHP